ncbi:MAG TPA: putative Ig domain-containing protein, partial [Tepidisphaeraceae bacterium]|nr:putative Ig domain-containing protein [Tepidisphaeraceae bacterium]
MSYSVTDGTAASNTATRAITVTAVNDAPVLAAIDGAALSYTENAAATAITATLTISDVDNANLTGATVQITNNYQNGQDVLAFTNANGITGSWNATTGTLTLSGTATVAQYQTALRSVTYANTSDNPTSVTRTVSFGVNDGSANSNTATRNISVTAVNDAPLLASIEGTSLAYAENNPATAVTSTLTVTDVDNANLTGATVQITGNYASGEDVLAFTDANGITGSWNAATGTLTLSGTATPAHYQTALRSVTYSNSSENPNTATRTVSFTITDSATTSAVATRTVAVTAFNDAPIVTSGATLGYTENDPAGAIDAGLSLSDVDSTNLVGATVTITGNFVAGQDELDATTGGTNITANYNAATGVLTLSGTDTVANYRTVLRSVTYRNTSDNPSTDSRSIRFTVSDGANLSQVSVDVTTSGTWKGAYGSDGYVIIGDTTSLPSYATVTPASHNSFTWAASTSDTRGLQKAASGRVASSWFNNSYFDVTVNITGSAMRQVAFYCLDWDTTTRAQTIEAFDASTGTSLAPAQAISSYNGGQYVVFGVLGNVRFRFTRTGANNVVVSGIFFDPASSAAATVTVAAVNDAPSVVATGSTLGYTENAAATAVDPGLTVADVDNANLTGATIEITGNYQSGEDVLAFTNANGITGSWNSATGVLTLSGTATVAQYQAALRSVTYANSSENPSTTTRTVSFTVTDGSANSNTATQNIAVTAVNDAPIIGSVNGGTGNYTEGNAPQTLDSNGTVTDIDSADFDGGTFTIDITANGSTDDRLAIRNQGTGAGQIGVSGANVTYGGIVIGTWTGGTNGSTPLVVTFNANADAAAAQALLRNFTFSNVSDTPSTATRTVRFTVTDGDGGTSNQATKNITVTATNDAPTVANPIPDRSAIEDVAFSYQFASNTFNDPDGDTLAYSATLADGSALPAWLNFDAATRTFSGTPANGDVGSVSVRVTVTDGSAASVSDDFTLTVANVNDAPSVATSDTTLPYIENDGAVAVDAAVTVVDVDDANLAGATVAITGNYASGQDVLAFTNQYGITGSWDAPTGTLTLTGTATVAQYQAALRSVTYRNTSDNPNTSTRTVSFAVTDGSLSSHTATRNVSITAVNDAPTVATPAAATPSPATWLQTTLSVQGADADHADSSLTYTWSVTSKPAGAADPTFSANGTNAAQGTTATFARAGTYTFLVTISDGSLSA